MPSPYAQTLVSRCRLHPAVIQESGTALPASQDTPLCFCPALRSRPGLHAPGLRPFTVTSYYVHDGAVPPGSNRKTPTIKFSGFNHAALSLAPYASCAPYGYATQCSLPSGCQPFSGGSLNPPGIVNTFHFFICFIIVSSCFGSWRDDPFFLFRKRRSRWLFQFGQT
jgi:hypothetical protein